MNLAYNKINASDLHYLPSSPYHPANTYFHFSFANYYDPTRMNFGALRVLNDDDVTPHSGFDRHPHRDMEIISYIVHGQLTHWDSVTQKEETIGRGDVQAISAGTGVWHSELNKHDEWCRFLQIWVMPNRAGGPVRYNHKNIELEDRENKLLHIVGNPENQDSAPLYINADVNFYASELTEADASVSLELNPGRQAYIYCVEGSLNIEGLPTLNEKDALEITDPTSLTFTQNGETAHFVVIEMKKQ
ncbi:pirin family protein [Vibrio superstes]|uniref:Pirin family protein n=1 Tax=Vibrio superstes NBRC 103154 TaxID=1219062 RepID=A0A511QP15_9VIBR|nr:pirin-like bicupin family protein [Vibrio superstes]GEM79073.1 hypothetical protein VSU01S_13180 [Vibrio superstes NBRC 103154]